mmetsp:Transcript_10284/g.28360  ORF Transcript_10284/g.28360 Transcript_10284/m.28360 type:complete len:97 (-) Transcript_10284:280-570(-)
MCARWWQFSIESGAHLYLGLARSSPSLAHLIDLVSVSWASTLGLQPGIFAYAALWLNGAVLMCTHQGSETLLDDNRAIEDPSAFLDEKVSEPTRVH